MKLLTLNTHSLEEKDYEKKLKIFTEEILKEKPDVIALQEVNQPLDGEEADGEVLKKAASSPARQSLLPVLSLSGWGTTDFARLSFCAGRAFLFSGRGLQPK